MLLIMIPTYPADNIVTFGQSPHWTNWIRKNATDQGKGNDTLTVCIPQYCNLFYSQGVGLLCGRFVLTLHCSALTNKTAIARAFEGLAQVSANSIRQLSVS